MYSVAPFALPAAVVALVAPGGSLSAEGRRGEAAPLRLRAYGGRKAPKAEPRAATASPTLPPHVAV